MCNTIQTFLQYVEHHPNYEKAKEWMEKNLSDELVELYLGDKGDLFVLNYVSLKCCLKLNCPIYATFDKGTSGVPGLEFGQFEGKASWP